MTPEFLSDLWRPIYHFKNKSDKEKSVQCHTVIYHFQEREICLLFYYCCEFKLSYRCFKDLSRSDKFFLFGINCFCPPRENDWAICPDYSQRPVNHGNMTMKYNRQLNLKGHKCLQQQIAF